MVLDAISLEWFHVRLGPMGNKDQCVAAGLCNCCLVWIPIAPWSFMVIARLLSSQVTHAVAMVRKLLLAVWNVKHF